MNTSIHVSSLTYSNDCRDLLAAVLLHKLPKSFYSSYSCQAIGE